MVELISYPNRAGFDRDVFSISLDCLPSLPHSLNLPSPNFAMLLACDATRISDAEIQSFADLLINNGIAYLCTWGPDCERVHDLMDIAIVQREIKEEIKYPIMTTWHNDESLDDALWFMLEVAYPDETYENSCGSSLVVSVANPEWDIHLRERLMNLQKFYKDVLKEEKGKCG
jgi:hypothetical protein